MVSAPRKPYANPTQTAQLPNATPTQIASKTKRKQYGNFLRRLLYMYMYKCIHVCAQNLYYMYISPHSCWLP